MGGDRDFHDGRKSKGKSRMIFGACAACIGSREKQKEREREKRGKENRLVKTTVA